MLGRPKTKDIYSCVGKRVLSGKKILYLEADFEKMI